MPPETRAGAKTWLAFLEWPVAQLMTLALALVGDFDTVVSAWKDNGGASLDVQRGFLAAAARASVRTELADEAMDYADHGVVAPGTLVAVMGELPELRDAMSLVWRILLLWLAYVRFSDMPPKTSTATTAVTIISTASPTTLTAPTVPPCPLPQVDAPASVAAFTDPTSPRMIAVTRPASTF